MRKFTLASCLFLTSFLPLSADLDRGDMRIVNPWTVTSLELETILEESDEDIVLEFLEGSMIPLNFLLKGDLISFEGNQENLGQLRVNKTFYIRLTEEDFLFSFDLLVWKPFEDLFMLELSFGFNSDDQNVPFFIVEAEIEESK